jgi:hypothetical protein
VEYVGDVGENIEFQHLSIILQELFL